MNESLERLESWAATLLNQLQPTKRHRLIREIAQALRRSQQQRIAAQHNPDGSAFTPRKPRRRPKAKHLRDKASRIRRKAMFIKLKTARFLKVESSAQDLTIGFTARAVRLAQVHQYGKIDQVAPGGPRYRYPARVLLGLMQEEKVMIRDRVLAYLLS